MSTVDLFQPLLNEANRRSDTYVAFHPRHWNLVSIVIEALDGEWDIRLKISRDVSPHAIYLCRDGQPAPISRVQLSSEGSSDAKPEKGLNAGSHPVEPKPKPEVES